MWPLQVSKMFNLVQLIHSSHPTSSTSSPPSSSIYNNASPFSSLLFRTLNNNSSYYPRTRRTPRTTSHPLPQALNPRLQLTMTAAAIHSPPSSSNRRPTCPSCSKPSRFCLCLRIQNPNLPNSIAVTILQHTLEKKHPLNSARIATLALQNLVLASVSDVHIHARFSIRFHESSPFYFTVAKYGEVESPPPPEMMKEMMNPQFATGDGCSVKRGFVVKKTDNAGCEEFEINVPAGSVLLFPSERAVGIHQLSLKQVTNLIVLDGTWAKAKRMYKENPWLNLLPHLKLETEMTPSLYSEVRSQPRDGCLSTIESIVYALKGLGDDETHGLDQLLQVFGSMVEDQRRCKNQRTMTAGT